MSATNPKITGEVETRETKRRSRNSPEGLIESILKQPLEVKLKLKAELERSIDEAKKEFESKLNLINGK
jgi:hypothetical protein